MPEHPQHNEHENRNNAAGAPEEPASVGELLRRQRKARGISVVEIAEHTKIGKKYLESLENDEFQALPGETYIRGFLKAVAKYLELDEEAILKRYKEQLGLQETRAQVSPETAAPKEESGQALWGPLLAVLVLAGLGAGLFLLWPGGSEDNATEREEAGTLMSSPLQTAPVPSRPQSGDLSLKIRAKEKSWVTLMVDGRQEPDVTLNTGEERTWTAKDRFVLWTGNAGGIEITFNGELQPPLGDEGEVRKEVIFERKSPTAGTPGQ